MPEQRNHRFSQQQELQVGTGQILEGWAAPSSPEGAANQAIADLMKPGAAPKAIEGITEQAKLIASNKQELISKIIKPMKGLDDTPPSPGVRSPAEKYADDIIYDITTSSSIPEDAAISMILKVWPSWSQKQYTWETFLNFISKAAKTFSNPGDVLEWSKNLFEAIQDGAPVFTPDYIMNVALDAVNTGDFAKYKNLLISLPFYKSVWSNKPIDTSEFSKSVSQISSIMELTRTPTQDMELVLRNMKAQNELITEFSFFYKSFLDWFQVVSISELQNAKKEIKDKVFDAGPWMQDFIRVQIKMKAMVDTITKGLEGQEVLGIDPKKKGSSSKLFKTVLAASPSSGTPSSSGSSPASPSSSTLTPTEQAAITEAMAVTRKELLFEARKKIIENNINQINSISEQKAKGLSGDLGLFSSFVNSGNVVKKIDDTIRLIEEQFKDAELIKKTSKDWVNKHTPKSSENEAVSAKRDTLNMNEMKYIAEQQNLKESSLSLKIQRIVLPKEIEYFELKQDYDTNISQLEAPVSALMVNSLVTTRNPRTGKLTTVNKRVPRPMAIKSAWETGKKIVALLMQISQNLKAGTNNTELGRAMFKNATNYYQAAIKQENANNNMLMKYLSNIGLGQVNYTPVDVGKK